MRRRRIALLACLLTTAAAPATAHPRHDGRIAFSYAADGRQDIVTVPPRGGELRHLTNVGPDQGAEGAAWDPSGRRVYFDSDLAGGIHAFRVDANGRHLVQLTFGDANDFAPRFAPGGRLVAIERDNADFTDGGVFLARITRDGFAGFRRLTTSPAMAMGGFDTPGDFSPDGARIAFLRVLSTSPPNAQSAVFVIGVDGRGLRQVTPYALNAISPRWSPDGSRLLFSDNSDNFQAGLATNVLSVRPDGTGLRRITHEPAGESSYAPDWSPDGRRIVYAHVSADGSRDLRIRDLATGRVTVAWAGADVDINGPDWGPR